MTMNLSDEGRRLIKSFEGYHEEQDDGSCVAYLCPAGVPTIGWGCTEGVKLGMRWTKDKAEAELGREIAFFESEVERVVTVTLTQNEFDACVSLAYNIGMGGKDRTGKTIPGFSTSTVLKRLNKGDKAGAASAFHMWRKGDGKVLPGLVSRRQREAALFLKPDDRPLYPYMPQKVEAVAQKPSRKIVALGTSAVTGGAAVIAETGIPAPPNIVGTSSSAISAWKGLILKSLADPVLLAGLGLVAAVFVIPWAIDKWRAA